MVALNSTNLALLPDWLSPEKILSGAGPVVVALLCLILFVESSIFPVLPGDTLLFTAGLFMASGVLDTPLWLVCTLATISAIVGNALGYYIGRRVGPALFRRPDSRFFKQEYVDKTHAFLEKHGPKAVVMARFVPFVRTFITWIAGVGRMDARRYFTYTVLGGILWATGLIVLGYLLGDISFIKDNVDAIFILIAVVSVLPMVIEYARNRRLRRGLNATVGEATDAVRSDSSTDPKS